MIKIKVTFTCQHKHCGRTVSDSYIIQYGDMVEVESLPTGWRIEQGMLLCDCHRVQVEPGFVTVDADTYLVGKEAYLELNKRPKRRSKDSVGIPSLPRRIFTNAISPDAGMLLRGVKGD